MGCLESCWRYWYPDPEHRSISLFKASDKVKKIYLFDSRQIKGRGNEWLYNQGQAIAGGGWCFILMLTSSPSCKSTYAASKFPCGRSWPLLLLISNLKVACLNISRQCGCNLLLLSSYINNKNGGMDQTIYINLLQILLKWVFSDWKIPFV